MGKKLIVLGLAAGTLFLFLFFRKEAATQAMAGQNINQDDLCENLLLSILNPTVQQEIDHYYQKYLTEPPMAGSASVSIVNITHSVLDGYDVELTVLPYYGPHNSVGKDKLILHIEDNTVLVKEFRHLESYEIYGSYRDYIIQWPPEEKVLPQNNGRAKQPGLFRGPIIRPMCSIFQSIPLFSQEPSRLLP